MIQDISRGTKNDQFRSEPSATRAGGHEKFQGEMWNVFHWHYPGGGQGCSRATEDSSSKGAARPRVSPKHTEKRLGVVIRQSRGNITRRKRSEITVSSDYGWPSNLKLASARALSITSGVINNSAEETLNDDERCVDPRASNVARRHTQVDSVNALAVFFPVVVAFSLPFSSSFSASDRNRAIHQRDSRTRLPFYAAYIYARYFDELLQNFFTIIWSIWRRNNYTIRMCFVRQKSFANFPSSETESNYCWFKFLLARTLAEANVTMKSP